MSYNSWSAKHILHNLNSAKDIYWLFIKKKIYYAIPPRCVTFISCNYTNAVFESANAIKRGVILYFCIVPIDLLTSARPHFYIQILISEPVFTNFHRRSNRCLENSSKIQYVDLELQHFTDISIILALFVGLSYICLWDCQTYWAGSEFLPKLHIAILPLAT